MDSVSSVVPDFEATTNTVFSRLIAFSAALIVAQSDLTSPSVKPRLLPNICGCLRTSFAESPQRAGHRNLLSDPLVRHKDVDVVLFTGSRAVGKHIQQVAGAV